MPPDDPLGRHGPSLDNFLRKKPLPTEQKRQLCPYGKIWLAQGSRRGFYTADAKPGFSYFLGFDMEGMQFPNKMTYDIIVFLHFCFPQTKSALMASSVSSTIQSGQTSPTCPWLMNWERKLRFLL